MTVAWVHDATNPHSFTLSLLGLQSYLLHTGSSGRYIAMRYGAGGIIAARNKTVTSFLEGTDEWLFWIDSDMGFEPTIVGDLMAYADAKDHPVVGALAFASKETDVDGFSGFDTFPIPTIYRWAKGPDGSTGFSPWHDYPRNQLVPCDGTGSACVLIHRSVFEDIRDKSGDVWYDPITGPDGTVFGEDLSFCIRCVEVDAAIHVASDVKTTHFKPMWLTERHHDIAMATVMAAEQLRAKST